VWPSSVDSRILPPNLGSADADAEGLS
jgi:hypothetical protein